MTGVDRIVLNAYFRMGHDPGGFRLWWRALSGGDETLDNTHLMRMAGRFSRRVRGYAKSKGIPVVDCGAGERKHELAEKYLTDTKITQGLFLILVGRAQAPVWDVGINHHLERKKPYVNHYSFPRPTGRARRIAAMSACASRSRRRNTASSAECGQPDVSDPAQRSQL